ncbi:MAG: SCO family protein [Betaproteobacteria bacterium]|nr:SCO family protein [Betaproteobacteria bacterium]MDE2131843.1 SCO family protein [Betaproteobacteria bacterium]MDE2211357.1 SCO family protein [Betaproteobacteria bacterium]
MKQQRLLVWATIAAAFLLLGGAWWMARHGNHPMPALSPSVQFLEGGQPLPQFRLESTAGIFTNDNLRGHWTFLLFGYTHCPDVCPTSLSLLAAVTDRLQGQANEAPQVIFVSVDAPRDTLSVLRQYVPAFHPGFVGATGSDEALKPFTRDLGLYYVRNTEERAGQEGGGYSVDHTSSIFLIAPDTRLRAVFQASSDARQMASDAEAIMTR